MGRGAACELATYGNFSFSFSYDTDPFIAFGVSVTNNTGSPLNYWFAFGSPYVGGPYDTVSSELLLQAFDETGNPAGDVTDIVHLSTVDGAPRLSPAAGVCSPPAVGCFAAAGSATLAPISGASGLFTSELSFTIGVEDAVVATGRTDLFNAGSNVPEPGALALALLGLAGMARLRARGRRG